MSQNGPPEGGQSHFAPKTPQNWDSPRPLCDTPAGSTILVTGAGGFVGGRVARALHAAGYRVRGWSRRPAVAATDDPPIEWVIGDLRDADARRSAVTNVAGVIHVAGWVSLGRDHRKESRAVNVDATRALLEASRDAGARVFLFTSTLWTVAAGLPNCPADESSQWNLEAVRCAYSDTKREAEAFVLAASRPGFRTAALCPGMVIGAGDRRPTSTGLLLTMARWPVVWLPRGGIPVVDAHVIGEAHVRALNLALPGRRYVVAGPYLTYHELAARVTHVAGRPWRTVTIPDTLERPLTVAAGWIDSLGMGLIGEGSAATVAGGFLRLCVSGAQADAAFGLEHPDPIDSIREALVYARQAGLAPWLRLRAPADEPQPTLRYQRRRSV